MFDQGIASAVVIANQTTILMCTQAEPTVPQEAPSNNQLKEQCYALREELLAIEKRAREFMTVPIVEITAVGQADISEAKANIMLAVRHIEDARMRVGKIVQAIDGGSSVYAR